MIEINGYRVTMNKDDLDELNGEIELRENVIKALQAQLDEADNLLSSFCNGNIGTYTMLVNTDKYLIKHKAIKE